MLLSQYRFQKFNVAQPLTAAGKRGLGLKWRDIVEFIHEVAVRFRSVVLENRDWSLVLRKYDGDQSLLYLDPPYVPTTRSKDLYFHEFTLEDHARLLEALRGIRGLAMLSGYDNPLYEEELSQWRRVEFQTHAWSAPGNKKPERTEVVWMNYNEDGNKIA